MSPVTGPTDPKDPADSADSAQSRTLPATPTTGARASAGAGRPSTSEQALQRAALAVSSASGPRVYAILVAELAAILGVGCAFIAVFDDPRKVRATTLAGWIDGRQEGPGEGLAVPWGLREVPEGPGFVTGGNVADFGVHTRYAGAGFDRYAAHALVGPGGESFGMLVAMQRTPFADPVLVESMLRIFAVRIAGEIERGRAEEALRRAAVAVSSAEGEAVFPELVRVLATVLGVEFAFIALPHRDDDRLLTMLAFYLDGDIRTDFAYPRAGTPCDDVLRAGYCAFPDRLADRFPNAGHLGTIGAESYAGLPLATGDGSALGLIAVASRKPLLHPELVESMLKIFAARARTEIDRARAEAALRASEEQYRVIFNASADALVLWDSSLRRVDVNPAYERIHGFSRDEVLRSDYRSDQSSEFNERRRDLIRRTLAGERCEVEMESLRKDGQRIQVEVRTIPVLHQGKPHVLAIVRDITERSRSDASLQASEAQYRAIFNAWADALVLRDAAFRIVDVNATYERYTGRRREDVLGIDRVIANPPGVDERVKALHDRVLKGEPVQFETQLLHVDGSSRELELRGVPIWHQGQPHVLYIGRDVTARRQADAERMALEAQLRQAQKMEAIGQLTGGIAHDFNNILQSILGYVVLAEERLDQLKDPQLYRYLQQVDSAAQRASSLVRQMLMFSRGESAERRPLSLAPLVREAVQMLRSTLPSTILLTTASDDDRAVVLVDPVQFEQVLLNLGINARDAMRGAGEIAISTRAVEVRGAACASCRQRVSGRFVELTVRDSGPGIPDAVLERMFEPFFTTKDVGKGSGMGLSMVHGIVHSHGGHVLVDNVPGGGTAVRVLLQAVEQDGEPRPAQASADRKWTSRQALRGRVLVAEDEAAIRELLQELLEGWGLEVAAVPTGADAVAVFGADPERFDLVLTDQTMPGMTGVALARQLSGMRPGLPVLLCTGFADDLPGEELRAAGIRSVARKPFEPAQLHAAIRNALAARREARRVR